MDLTGYLVSFTYNLSNVGKIFWDRIQRDHRKLRKEKENFCIVYLLHKFSAVIIIIHPCFIASLIYVLFHLILNPRFKRWISHVLNLTQELNACEVRHLNQLNATFAYLRLKPSKIWLTVGSTFDSNVAFHVCRT